MGQNKKQMYVKIAVVVGAASCIAITLGYMVFLAMTTRTPAAVEQRAEYLSGTIDHIEQIVNDELYSEEKAIGELQVYDAESAISSVDTAIQAIGAVYDSDGIGDPATFCRSVPQMSSDYAEQLDSAIDNYTHAKNLRTPPLSGGGISIEHSTNDSYLEDAFIQLKRKAKTTSQKRAVEMYKNEVMGATETRRSTYDAARTAFQSQSDAMFRKMDTENDARVAAYRTALLQAEAKATQSCNGATDTTSIQSQYSRDLMVATNALMNYRASTAKTELQKITRVRDTTVKKSANEFHNSLQSARSDIKRAFKDSSEEI